MRIAPEEPWPSCITTTSELVHAVARCHWVNRNDDALGCGALYSESVVLYVIAGAFEGL